jgi:hypothetical protein
MVVGIFDISNLGNVNSFFESLILAQDERWRYALSMQVDRLRPQGRDRGGRVSNDKERTLK